MSNLKRRMRSAGFLTLGAAASVGMLALAGCSSGASSTDADAAAVTLIVKTTTNPYFVAMQDGAEQAAEEAGVELTLAAGQEDGDEATQIQAVENAISRGDDGILITANGPGVEDALVKAREAGIYVIALDTAPQNPEAVDMTFATDNFLAGQKIGEWTAKKLGGDDAVIAMIDLFDDKAVSVDYNRDQGFLDGMGIDVADPAINGDEEATGTYSGGEYEIVGNQAGEGAEDGGRTAAETLLSQNEDINVVYTINEPTAYGASQAFEAAGKDDVIIVSIDGGCTGVEQTAEGLISATSQQFPLKMAELGVEAIDTLVKTGEAPEASEGLDFFNTGVDLVTDDPQDGVESVSTDDGLEQCWG